MKKKSCKHQFNLNDSQFNDLISYLTSNDTPEHNTAVIVKLNIAKDFEKTNTIHVTQFFHDALKHARKHKK